MLAAEPNALDVDVVSEIPNLLWSINGVCKGVTSMPEQEQRRSLRNQIIAVTYLRHRRA
jgi:hypothetical protein